MNCGILFITIVGLKNPLLNIIVYKKVHFCLILKVPGNGQFDDVVLIATTASITIDYWCCSSSFPSLQNLIYQWRGTKTVMPFHLYTLSTPLHIIVLDFTVTCNNHNKTYTHFLMISSSQSSIKGQCGKLPKTMPEMWFLVPVAHYWRY